MHINADDNYTQAMAICVQPKCWYTIEHWILPVRLGFSFENVIMQYNLETFVKEAILENKLLCT